MLVRNITQGQERESESECAHYKLQQLIGRADSTQIIMSRSGQAVKLRQGVTFWFDRLVLEPPATSITSTRTTSSTCTSTSTTNRSGQAVKLRQGVTFWSDPPLEITQSIHQYELHRHVHRYSVPLTDAHNKSIELQVWVLRGNIRIPHYLVSTL